MDENNIVYSYNCILFGNKQKWSADTCCNMDELWKHCTKWRKPVTNMSYCIISFIWNGYNRWTYRDRICLAWASGERWDVTAVISGFFKKGFSPDSHGKESICSPGDLGSILGLRRSPGEGNGNPLQHSCLENTMDRGAWWVQSRGLQRVGHDWVTYTYFLT